MYAANLVHFRCSALFFCPLFCFTRFAPRYFFELLQIINQLTLNILSSTVKLLCDSLNAAGKTWNLDPLGFNFEILLGSKYVLTSKYRIVFYKYVLRPPFRSKINPKIVPISPAMPPINSNIVKFQCNLACLQSSF